MAGNTAQGKLAAQTNKQKYDEIYQEKYGTTFYEYIGSQGGATKTNKPKGFAANPELARIAGRKGGYTSRRGSKKNES